MVTKGIPTIDEDAPNTESRHRSKAHHRKSSKHRHHHHRDGSRSHHHRDGSRPHYHHSKHHKQKDDSEQPDQPPVDPEGIDAQVTQARDSQRYRGKRQENPDDVQDLFDPFGPEFTPDPQAIQASRHKEMAKDSKVSHDGGPELKSALEGTSLANPERRSKKKQQKPSRHEADYSLLPPPTPRHSIEQTEKLHVKSEVPEFLPDERGRHSVAPVSNASLEKKDPKILSDTMATRRDSLVEVPQEGTASFRPRPPQTTRYPGAFREGDGPDDYDVETAVFPDDNAANTGPNSLEAEVSGLPVASPLSAELASISCMRDWWSKPRNKLMFCGGLLIVIGGFVGLIVALAMRGSNSSSEAAVAVPECIGMTALAWGEPHLTTFDNLQYDCQAAGEFVLVRSLNEPFEVQGRFMALDYDSRVSKITATAISEAPNTPLIQVSLPTTASESTDKVDVCLVDLLVDGTPTSVLEGHVDDTVDISVAGNNINVLYPISGVVVTAKVMSSSAFDCFLNVFVCLPYSSPSLFNTVGLMGTPNGALSDDWMDQNGNTLELPLSEEGLLYDPAYEYCTSNWCIRNETESLFNYNEGYPFQDYENCDAPYPGPVTSEEASDEVKDRCGENAACLIEGSIGGGEGADNAINVQAALDETRNRTETTTEQPTASPPITDPTSSTCTDLQYTEPDFEDCNLEVKTHNGPNDGLTDTPGIMFNLKALSDLTVNSLTVPFADWYSTDQIIVVSVWTKSGSYACNTDDTSSWKQIFSQEVNPRHGGNFLLESTQFIIVDIAKDSTQAFYIWVEKPTDAVMNLRTRHDDVLRSTTPITLDRSLELYSGVDTATEFVPSRANSQGSVFHGIVHYNLCAQPLPYAAKCSSTSTSLSGPIDGQTTATGIMFDVKASADLSITTFTVPFVDWYGTLHGVVSIWTKPGSYIGSEKDVTAWNLLFSQAVSGGGWNYQLNADEFENVDINSGSTQAFYVLVRMAGSEEVKLRTRSDNRLLESGTPVTYDRSLELSSGVETISAFTPDKGGDYGSVFSGILHYSLCAPPPPYPAQCTSTSTSLSGPIDSQTTATGIMFDVNALVDLTITTLTVPFVDWYGSLNGIVSIWTKQDSYIGSEKDVTAWKLIFSQAVSGGGWNYELNADEFENVDINSGSTQAFYVLVRMAGSEEVKLRTRSDNRLLESGTPITYDRSLKLSSGVETTSAFMPSDGNDYGSVFCGIVHYSLCSPPLQYTAICSSTSASLSGPIDGQTNAAGIMFDIKVQADLTITTLTVPFVDWYGSLNGVVSIWTKQGSYVGSENDVNAWNLIFSQAVSGGGWNYQLNADEFKNVDITSGSTQAFYVLVRMAGSEEVKLRTLSDSVNKTTSIPVTFDRSIDLLSGIGTGAPFVAQVANEYGSVFSGVLHYDLCAPPLLYPAKCATVSSSLVAPFQGQASAQGIMFDMRVLSDITVTTFTVPFVDWYGTLNGVVSMWTKPGSYVGSEKDVTAWNLLFSQAISGGGWNYQLDADEFKNVDITADSTQAFYVSIRLAGSEDMKIRAYTNVTSVGSLAFSDSFLEVYSGVTTGQMFTPYTTAAAFDGEIHYSTC